VAAVEILYGADVREVDASALRDERGECDPYTDMLVAEVTRRRDELDDVIGRHSIGWRIGRMSPVDRNVLRVAVLELLLRDVPAAAVIDEALEIAKRFSGEEAGRFVNGVLSAVLQDVGGGRDGGGYGGGSSPGGGGAGDGGGGGDGSGGCG
jgi:N utilization substance protein B